MASNPSSIPPVTAPAPQVILYGHSWLFYWWPVWVVGYIMALLTWLHPVTVQIGDNQVQFTAQNNLGVIYALVVLLTILVTNTRMRGLVSLVVVLSAAVLALVLLYFDVWPDILRWFGAQTVFMNLGFYLFISTALLIVWILVVGFFDHLSFCGVRPGQITHEYVMGAVESSYETDNMVFSKEQADLFRNWILGFGSGDLQMQTMGGNGVVAKVANVLFLNARMAAIRSLIATKPDAPEKT